MATTGPTPMHLAYLDALERIRTDPRLTDEQREAKRRTVLLFSDAVPTADED